MARKTLKGVRVAVLAADGFEQVELTGPVKHLRKHGADVRIISLRPGSIRGMNLLAPGKQVDVDETLSEATVDDYDALFIPGGFVNPDFLRQSDRALHFVRAFDRAGKPIGVICHSPWVLASAGLTRGRRLTSWPGIADDLRNAGALWTDSAVVRDRNFISSRGPMDLPAFEPALVSFFAELAQPEERLRARGGQRSWLRRLVRGLALAGTVYVARRALAQVRA